MTTKPRKTAPTKEAETMPAVLDLAAVGVIVGRCRPGPDKSPVSGRTVSIYVTESNPDLNRVKPGRYIKHPFPTPASYIGRQPGKDRGGYPVWLPEQIPAIEDWARTRLGPGAGGGRPVKAPGPPLSEGYVPCSVCDQPIELHTAKGLQKGKKRCTESWTKQAIRGARRAANLNPDYTLD